MAEAGLNLFIVECRCGERVSTFFVPAHSSDAAIERAKVVAKEAQAEEADVIDPFLETGSEVRVGNFEAPGSQTIIFGDWSPVS